MIVAHIAQWLPAWPQLPAWEERLLRSVAILLVLAALRFAVLFVVGRNTQDARLRYHWRKGLAYAVGFIGLFLIGRVWFEGVRSLATYLGLLSAGLALALREPIANVAAWTVIISRRPFAVGDRVEIGTSAGDVIDQRLFQFTLLEIGNWVGADQSTGRMIHVPNGLIFTQPLANYTRGFPYLWHEVPVLISFESDWERAKTILLEIAERHGRPFEEAQEATVLADASEHMILYSTLAPTVYTRAREHGIELSIRYLCHARRRRGTEQAIWEDVLRAFAAHPAIAFAYPTRRTFDHKAEGKPALRPDAAAGVGVAGLAGAAGVVAADGDRAASPPRAAGSRLASGTPRPDEPAEGGPMTRPSEPAGGDA